MATWRLARALSTLCDQINAAHPSRNKSHDGTIGDTAHAARASDHNPNKAGVVTAMDITHDPAGGVDSYALAERLRLQRDPRIKYVISNGRIFSSVSQPWEWRPYAGASKHDKHVHISVSADPARYDDPAPWSIPSGGATMPAPVSPEPASDLRWRMGKAILDFEARRDAKGHLAVYKLPAGDGGGSYEVAGINDRYHLSEASALRDLVVAGRHAEAESRAIRYLLSYTSGVARWHSDPGVEFFLRDTAFNRGPTGAAKIFQRALGVRQDGVVGAATRAAAAAVAAPALLTALRAAREAYEREVVGYRPQFWAGLTNRWNKALATAQQLSGAASAKPASRTKAAAGAAGGAIAAGGAAAAAAGQDWTGAQWGLVALAVVIGVSLAAGAGWLAWRWWQRRRAAAQIPTIIHDDEE